MKGVILAGGLGTRLHPLTRVTNKHLLPVWNRPMIHYPIQCLVNAGIKDIMIVTGGNNAGDFLRLLGNGEEFGLKQIFYAYQKGEGGIADALRIAEHFADGEPICVVLGDNIIERNIVHAVATFDSARCGARIILKEVEDPERFGVAELVLDRVVSIEEKPKRPKSKLAVIGIYMYDAEVFEIISDRYLALGINDRKLSVIHNGVSQVTQRFGEMRKRLKLADSTFLAVAAGRLEEQKRFDLLLQVWSFADSHDANAHLAIFGRGPQEEALKSLTREMNLESSVTFAGFDSDFASLVGDADVFVLTSENEGTPNAVLEAMSAGVSVLGFDVGAMKTLLRGSLSDFLIRAGDAQALNERLSYWISNREELRSHRAEFAVRAKSEFSFDVSMRRYVEVFQAVVEQSARA